MVTQTKSVADWCGNFLQVGMIPVIRRARFCLQAGMKEGCKDVYIVWALWKSEVGFGEHDLKSPTAERKSWSLDSV